MKTSCLFVALSGLATAQQPVPGAPPEVRIQELRLHSEPGVPPVPAVPRVPGVPGMPADIAIASRDARELVEPLTWAYSQAHMRGNDVVRPGPVGFIGVNATVLPRELSAHLSLPEDTGLLIEAVGKDSPAEKGGLQANDVLAKLDEQILIDQRQFSVLVANKKEGDNVKITYIRKGETHETSVVIGKREGGRTMAKPEADVLFKHTDGAPLRTFVRRFKMPGGGGGEVKVEGDDAVLELLDAGAAASPAPGAPLTPPNEDVKKQLEEIRAMLEALQQKVK